MAKKSPQEPRVLDNQHHDVIKSMLEKHAGLPAAMDRAEKHGCNCTQAREAYHMSKEGLEKILSDYFPNGRLKDEQQS